MAFETCSNCGEQKHQLNACSNYGFTKRRERFQLSDEKPVIENKKHRKVKNTQAKKKSLKIEISD